MVFIPSVSETNLLELYNENVIQEEQTINEFGDNNFTALDVLKTNSRIALYILAFTDRDTARWLSCDYASFVVDVYLRYCADCYKNVMGDLIHSIRNDIIGESDGSKTKILIKEAENIEDSLHLTKSTRSSSDAISSAISASGRVCVSQFSSPYEFASNACGKAEYVMCGLNDKKIGEMLLDHTENFLNGASQGYLKFRHVRK